MALVTGYPMYVQTSFGVVTVEPNGRKLMFNGIPYELLPSDAISELREKTNGCLIADNPELTLALMRIHQHFGPSAPSVTN